MKGQNIKIVEWTLQPQAARRSTTTLKHLHILKNKHTAKGKLVHKAERI